MKRTFSVIGLLVLAACSANAPVETAPATPAPAAQPSAPAELGVVQVTASAVNVRREPNTGAEVLMQAKKNERLTLLATAEDWSKVRLGDGTIGWVASRFVVREGAAAPKSASKSSHAGCNTDFAFVKTPTPSMSEREPRHGLVVVDAYVNASGDVTSTKVISNDTGDESLAALAQREIKSAKFEAPKRNCVAKAFIFTYKRSF